MLPSSLMKSKSKQLHELLAKTEASMNKTANPQQAFAQMEAALLRKENQKVTEKSQNI